ncbi:putative PurR-regulated permease PerM [Rhodoligotrophos appendicifer]|uniref:AI-2E family transporter n=1 Tax=Rhodoligotrophos appendicifer TaxID=987056 RepID=UPI001FE3545C|nr:AI-2E family transporter [Rhodoligotrophos appendicifer]
MILSGLALFATLGLHLLTALLAGLLVYTIVHAVAPHLKAIGLSHEPGKVVVLILVFVITIIMVGLAIFGLTHLLVGGSDSLPALMQKMADILSTARIRLPSWASQYLPENGQQIESTAANWLRENAGLVQKWGEDFGRVLLRILFGMIIGGFVAVSEVTFRPDPRPLTEAVTARIALFARAFRRVVFAQVRISAINTVLTAIYLGVVLPSFGVHLPLLKTVIIVTFLVGLLPVLGNLISNTVIVIVSLSVSPYVAVASLAYLVIIHKLEYFLNAKIIGGHIQARIWEVLLAMLVMEAAFGVAGLVAAPIYYAYVKDELALRGLI